MCGSQGCCETSCSDQDGHHHVTNSPAREASSAAVEKPRLWERTSCWWGKVWWWLGRTGALRTAEQRGDGGGGGCRGGVGGVDWSQSAPLLRSLAVGPYSRTMLRKLLEPHGPCEDPSRFSLEVRKHSQQVLIDQKLQSRSTFPAVSGPWGQLHDLKVMTRSTQFTLRGVKQKMWRTEYHQWTTPKPRCSLLRALWLGCDSVTESLFYTQPAPWWQRFLWRACSAEPSLVASAFPGPELQLVRERRESDLRYHPLSSTCILFSPIRLCLRRGCVGRETLRSYVKEDKIN